MCHAGQAWIYELLKKDFVIITGDRNPSGLKDFEANPIMFHLVGSKVCKDWITPLISNSNILLTGFQLRYSSDVTLHSRALYSQVRVFNSQA